MRCLSLIVAVTAIGCGNNPGSNSEQPGGWLGQQNAGEIALSGKSCEGPFTSEMTPDFEHLHAYSTEIAFRGKNRTAIESTNSSSCDELAKYLSASMWSENGQQFANDIRMTIDFQKNIDSNSDLEIGVPVPIRVGSAHLYLLDGSLTEKVADVELRCPGSFSLECTQLDHNQTDCVDFKISYPTQKCTFRGDGIEITYANHKRSDLQFLGDLFLNSNGTASMKIDKASRMVMY
jgi:hypothetical protein